MGEAANSYRTPHGLPAQTIDQLDEHLLKSDAVQWIIWLVLTHCGLRLPLLRQFQK